MTDWPGRRVSTGPALAVRATSPASPYARDRVEAPSNRPAARTPTLRSRTQDVIRSAPGALTAARERQVYDTTWEDVGRGAQELTGLPSLARGAGGLAALPAVARSGFLGPQHALPAAGALAETALGLAGPMMLPRSAGRVAAPVATEAAQPIPRIAREIGPNGMPIAQSQPYRNSLRGGSSDLREAAGMGARPTNGPIRAYHGSPDDIDAFRPGTHFGTSDAASQRLRDNRVTDGGRIYPVDLPQGQYLRVPEAGNMWDNAEWWQTQARADIHTPMSREQRALWDAIESDRALSQARGPAVAERLGQIMREHGFEGASYHNRWEGGDSYFMPDASRARMALSSPPPTTPTGTSPFGDPRAYPQSAWEEFGSLQGGTPEARGQRAPRRVVDVRTPRGETHETIVNPTEADILRLTQPGRVAAPGLAIDRGVPISSSRGVRYIKDADGNVYVGNSYDVTHHDLVTHYGLPNRGSLDGGEIVRLPDGTLELQNNDGAMPLPRGWLSGRAQTLPDTGNPPQPLLGGTPEARLRAQEQGFDTGRVLYHGTTRDFGAFDVNAPSANWPNKGRGIFLTRDPQVASRYAHAQYADGENIIPVYVRGNIQRLGYDDYGRAIDGKSPKPVETAVRRGHAGIENDAETLVFDPRNIRSIFAAFDPAKRDSSDLLALTNDPMADPMISRAGALRGLAASEGPRLPPPGNEDRYLFGRPTEATVRQQRIADQGYEGPFYHGTMRDVSGSFRPSLSGANGPGVYMGATPETAASYAGIPSPDGIPLQVSGRNVRMDYARTPYGESGGNIMPLYARGPMATRADWRTALRDAQNELRAPDQTRREVQELAQRKLQGQGYTGLRDTENDYNVIFPDADGQVRNVRSAFAAFDPARRNDPDLLAGLTAAAPIPIAASALTQQQNTTGRPRGRPSDSQRSRGAFDRTGR